MAIVSLAERDRARRPTRPGRRRRRRPGPRRRPGVANLGRRADQPAEVSMSSTMPAACRRRPRPRPGRRDAPSLGRRSPSIGTTTTGRDRNRLHRPSPAKPATRRAAKDRKAKPSLLITRLLLPPGGGGSYGAALARRSPRATILRTIVPVGFPLELRHDQLHRGTLVAPVWRHGLRAPPGRPARMSSADFCAGSSAERISRSRVSRSTRSGRLPFSNSSDRIAALFDLPRTASTCSSSLSSRPASTFL